MKKILCFAFFVAAFGMICFGNPTYEYRPDSLPQDSEPAWAVLGGAALSAEVLDGVLHARTDKPSWSQWRIGMAPGATREFGDASALQIPESGALTLDFMARIDPNGPDLPTLMVAVSNGSCGPSVTFSPGQISVSGVSKPIMTDPDQWGYYRVVVEGNQMEFFCVNTQTSLKAEISRGDWGKTILFGFPALEGEGEGIARTFEIKSIKWQPGVADRQFPAAAQE